MWCPRNQVNKAFSEGSSEYLWQTMPIDREWWGMTVNHSILQFGKSSFGGVTRLKDRLKGLRASERRKMERAK